MAERSNRAKYRAMAMAFDCHYRELGRLGDPCVYCGIPSSEYDHIPPLTYVSRLPREMLDTIWMRKVPSCHECNSFLGGRVSNSIMERREIVKEKLRAKYATYLKMPRWDSDETAELGKGLRKEV